MRFLTEETIATKGMGYIRTTKGELLQVKDNKCVRIAAPGNCEAIARDENGNLIWSFRDLGIFKLTNDWVKLLNSPYLRSELGHAIALAVDQTEIALAFRATGETQSESQGPQLWVSINDQWREVAFH